MIDPQKCAALILDRPELAKPFLDILVWAEQTKNLKDDNAYDDLLDMAYSKLDEFRAARDKYIADRAA